VKWLLPLVATAGIAHADPAPVAPAADPAPDPAAERAADANLESVAPRQGVTFSAALGGSLTLGIGLDDSVGKGGGGSFRLGHVMSHDSVVTVELLFSAVVRRAPDMSLVTNNNTNLLVGIQYFIGPSLFVRAAGGFGDYIRNKVDVGGGVLGTRKVAGPAGAIGVGLEVIHAKHISVEFESFSVGMPNRDGLLSTTAFCIGASYY
jgi:hypothetical protein